jgi:hypothetical protein
MMRVVRDLVVRIEVTGGGKVKNEAKKTLSWK